MTTVILEAAMPLHGPVDRNAATWVGLLDTAELSESTETVLFVGGERFDRARLLVRDGAGVRGYISIALVDGVADAAVVRAAVSSLATLERQSDGAQMGVRTPMPPVSVVVCTRDRPEMLRETLRSLSILDADDLEVVIVDNAPATASTAELVATEFPAFRYVREDIPGLSHARNAGLRAASASIVAFTDDDVIVDPQWARQLTAGFDATDDVGCVTGAVPSGELRNSVQSYFDARVGWSKILRPRVFRLSEPPRELPMFPFCVGEFGTGANFAVRRDQMLALGGFDTALGAGTETKGGEDLDMFLRILTAGTAIVVNPAAIAWHRHRADLEALTAQAVGYGRGFGAWATTVLLEPSLATKAMIRAPRAAARLLRKPLTSVDDDAARATSTEDRSVARRELVNILSGPASYFRERRRQLTDGVFAGPLSRGTVFDRRAWAAIAAAAALCGVVAAIPSPTWLSLTLLACFVLVGPGAVVRAWVPLPRSLTALAVPALGIAAMLLLVTASVFAAWWHPAWALAAVSAVTLTLSLVTYRIGAQA